MSIADGLCGTDAHARDDIKKKLKERLPSSQARFTYNDATWNAWTGEFMELNGIFAQLGLEIASLMKQPSQSSKSVEEGENRKERSQEIVKKADRDGVDRQEADKKNTEEHDLFHALFGEEVIDTLFKTMTRILRNLNNAGSGGSGGGSNRNKGAEAGATGRTEISNTEATCLTDSILSEINEEIKNQIQDKKSKSRDEANKKSGETGSRINEILDALQPVMQFPLTQKYSKFNSLFNRDRSQDKRTKQDGCINEREYSTQMGTLASIMGFAGTLVVLLQVPLTWFGGDNFGKRDLSAVEFADFLSQEVTALLLVSCVRTLLLFVFLTLVMVTMPRVVVVLDLTSRVL